MTATPPGRPAPPAPQPRTRLVIGPLSLAGPAALVVALLLLAAVVALIVWSRPSIGMLLAGAIWLGYSIYWSATARRPRPGTSAESPRSRALHQLLLNVGLLLLFVSIPGLRWRFIPRSAWHVPLGLGIMAAATWLHIRARVHLGRNWTSQVMILEGHQLVRTGPYRRVRHPIYTAILLLALGTAVISGRVLGLIGFALFAIAYVRKLRIEERVLGAEFGPVWGEYRCHSRALVPWVY